MGNCKGTPTAPEPAALVVTVGGPPAATILTAGLTDVTGVDADCVTAEEAPARFLDFFFSGKSEGEVAPSPLSVMFFNSSACSSSDDTELLVVLLEPGILTRWRTVFFARLTYRAKTNKNHIKIKPYRRLVPSPAGCRNVNRKT